MNASSLGASTLANLGPILAITWFGSIVAFVAAYNVLLGRAVARLQETHPDVARTLRIDDGSLPDAVVLVRARKYISSRDCRELGDAELTRLRAWCLVFGFMSAGLMLALAGFMLWGGLSDGFRT